MQPPDSERAAGVEGAPSAAAPAAGVSAAVLAVVASAAPPGCGSSPFCAEWRFASRLASRCARSSLRRFLDRRSIPFAIMALWGTCRNKFRCSADHFSKFIKANRMMSSLGSSWMIGISTPASSPQRTRARPSTISLPMTYTGLTVPLFLAFANPFSYSACLTRENSAATGWTV